MTDAAPRTYPQGVPCWIDLETADADAAGGFYSSLLGWRLDDAMPPAAPGHYLVATLDGRDAAAIASGAAAVSDEQAWSTYIAVDDADATAAAVERAGGAVLCGPDDNPGGRFATCRDPQGAVFRLWQAGRRLGAQAVNEPGAWNFSDLRTTDVDAATAFYREVFGWRVTALGPGAGAFVQVAGYGEHLAATADPEIFERQAAVGGSRDFADAVGSIVPAAEGEAPHWHVTFTVADRDAAVRSIEQAGGRVRADRDTPWARASDVEDPLGAAFSVSQFAPEG